MMNDKITIQTPPTDKDAAGQIVGDWSSLPEVWADIKWPTGAEAVRNGLTTSTVQASMMVRARSDVDESMRVVHSGKVYNIKAVLPYAKDRRFMFLVCEAAK